MATRQSTISFKSRKRTYYNEAKEKTNNENRDTLNIVKRTTLNRGEAKEKTNNESRDTLNIVKRTTLKRGEAKEKTNHENSDTLNIVKRTTLKRGLKGKDSDVISEEDKILAKKVRIAKDNLTTLCDDSANESNVYASTTPLEPLVSREKETEFIQNFLFEHLDKEQSGSLYISGQPGTGKTASLSYILQVPKIRDGYKKVYINCSMVKPAASIYSRICKELQLPTSGKSAKVCLNAIENYLFKKHKMILLVLDEIDQLGSARQTVLYRVFEWAARAAGLVLVGVANALDLTERALPRLQARGLRPAALHFAPYTKQQIIDIFSRVLAADNNAAVFSPAALQMLAAKIAAVSGDMRRALDIGRRVIDLARRTKFGKNQSIDEMLKDSLVTVELKQVLEALRDVYGGARKFENEVDEGLPIHQKLILCSLMLMLTKGKNKEIVMGKLHDVYKRVAAARNMAALELGELAGACALLEARGAVRVVGGAGGRGGVAARARRLHLQWDECELAAALRDRPLLASILADTACLAP